MLREYYFHLIGQHRIHDDQTICLDILNTLTKGGQNLLYIDEQVGGLISHLSIYPIACRVLVLEIRHVLTTNTGSYKKFL